MPNAIRFSKEYFSQKAAKVMELIDIIKKEGPEAEKLIDEAIKAVSDKWKEYSDIKDTDQPHKGFLLENFEGKPLYLCPNGTVAIKDKFLFSPLTVKEVIAKYGALPFLIKLDEFLDMSIETYSGPAKDFQGAIGYAANK